MTTTVKPKNPRPRTTAKANKAIAQATKILETFLTGRADRTAVEYERDLRKIAGFLGHGTDVRKAVADLIGAGPGNAYGIAERYKGAVRDRIASNTVNRRLATMRSLVQTAYYLGVITWTLHVRGLRAHPTRDTRGPGLETIRAMIGAAKAEHRPAGDRDVAIITTVYTLALRRAELLAIDNGDVDLKNYRIAVLQKGWTQRQTLSLPQTTQEALARWIIQQPYADNPNAPVFTNLSRAHAHRRLSGTGLGYILGRRGRQAGSPHVTPHGIRHTAITDAHHLRADILETREFSRHARVETVQVYVDQAEDIHAEIASQLAEGLSL